jgi:acetyl-CoA carboxylase carboxyl transferase subunit alpha
METTAFDRVLTARNPDRPYSMDLFSSLFTDFVEIHGDRRYADDPAIVCGFARIDSVDVAVIGQQKGRDINERRHRNFAMPKPEGYRKALRMMHMAEKFGRPLITLIDTPGAYPGIDAEERGQAEAIAFNLREMASLKIPVIVVVLGEGGSGGALAIGIGDRVLMMENAVYSVISPEGCAAILWKDSDQANLAAEAMRITAGDLKKFDLIDEVISEPEAWNIAGSEGSPAAKNADKVEANLKKALVKHLKELTAMAESDMMEARYQKLRKMGQWV